MSATETLQRDVERTCGTMPAREWHALESSLRAVSCNRGQLIFTARRRGLAWLFLTRGVAASEQPEPDGSIGISRFFEAGQFCTNVTSLSDPAKTGEVVAALTPVEGVVISHKQFIAQYHKPTVFGAYLRVKIMEAVLFDRELMRVKTAYDIATRYAFLRDRHVGLVERVAPIQLARFIGVPEPQLAAYLDDLGQSGDAKTPATGAGATIMPS